MRQIFTVDQVRRGERPLLDAQAEPDDLMHSAAAAVAATARELLADDPRARVLLLVGPGGNGGDALFAGANLLRDGSVRVDAWFSAERAHPRAAAAFREHGGTVLDGPVRAEGYTLAIDGIAGLGGTPGLSDNSAWVVESLNAADIPILAVDLPSGLAADDPTPPEPREITHGGRRRMVAGHVRARTTVTFGGLRRIHALSPHCGEVVLHDISVPGLPPLSRSLATVTAEDPPVFLDVAVDRGDPRRGLALGEPIEPDASANKYTGGVVGILAGNHAYPGAGILAVGGAVRATPSMVRYVGSAAASVVAAHPEVIVTDALAKAGQVQAWVIGPGRGTDAASASELDDILATDLPAVVDADALTLLAADPALRQALRGRRAPTVLTPHAREGTRLAEALGLSGSPLDTARGIAAQLGAVVVWKGRSTIVTSPDDRVGTVIVDAGHSWSATPGSGDVLSGILGAWMARMPRPSSPADVHAAAHTAVSLHAEAAWLASLTSDGEAQIVASDIARELPRATARAARRGRQDDTPPVLG